MIDISTKSAGIDVAKAKLDVAIHGRSERLQISNNLRGFKTLVAHLRREQVTRVGIEATGGYERGVVAHLRAAGFAAVVLQPVQVRAFARAQLRRAKNDGIDAILIAAFTAIVAEVKPAPDERLVQLAPQLTYVEQLEEDIARLKTRIEKIDDPRLRRVVLDDIARFKVRRKAELARIVEALRAHQDLAGKLDLVLSIPGLGVRTAVALVVRMPELGSISREQAASLAGLAPFDADSGQHEGQRHIAGGRARLRRSLFAAALPAAFRWNKALIALYGRLLARGKAHKAALTACARKLVVYANTVVARGTPWVDAAPAV
jgi:transposase